MNVLVIDGHPDEGRLLTELLDGYVVSLAPDTTVKRVAVRHLRFNPDLTRGYAADQLWEDDIANVANAMVECDHLVIGFPLWWGAEPAMLKGLMDRILLPGFAFSYRHNSVFWDRLLQGRSADLIITMDTPPWYLRLVYGDAVVRRWKAQILSFCGFRPVRTLRLGPTRRGEAKKRLPEWRRRIARMASSAQNLSRGSRPAIGPDRKRYTSAIEDRMS